LLTSKRHQKVIETRRTMNNAKEMACICSQYWNFTKLTHIDRQKAPGQIQSIHTKSAYYSRLCGIYATIERTGEAMTKYAIIYNGRVLIPAEGKTPGQAYNAEETGIRILAAFEDTEIAGMPNAYFVKYDDTRTDEYQIETDAERIKAVEYFDSLLLHQELDAEELHRQKQWNRQSIYRKEEA